LRALASILSIAAVTVGWTTGPMAATEVRVSLHLRDTPIRQVPWALARLTGQEYVVDGDVLGTVDLDVQDASRREVEDLLSEVGVFVTGEGRIRRVSTSGASVSGTGGSEFPVSLDFQMGDARDIRRLMMDSQGNEIVAPAGEVATWRDAPTRPGASSIRFNSLLRRGVPTG